MIIVNKTDGPKIPYSFMPGVDGLLILDNQLYLNLPTYERDFPVHLDISYNEYHMITMGLSRQYVAQIDIPAREYTEVETDQKDEDGNVIVERQPVPFDVDKVTLTLWGLE